MKRRRTMIVLIVSVAVIVVAALAAVAVAIRDGDSEPERGGIELAGSRVSDADLRDISKDVMGEADLEDVPEAGPHSARADEAGELKDGVRAFTLRATPVRWEFRDGQRVAAWGYNGQVPGPTLRATEGERIKVTFTNDLPQPTSVHWHGVDVPWTEDGVPGVTQKPIEPGDSYTYEFTATPAGTRWYHTHGSKLGDEPTQLDMGLAGALVIDPEREQRAEVDRVLVLDEWSIGAGGYNAAMLAGHGSHGAGSAFNVFTINGRAAPSTEEIVVQRGDRVRLRFVNASSVSYHPMHIHGHQARVVALDGNPVPSPTIRNVELLAPGQTADLEFIADNPGVWMLHCHDLHHSSTGMSLLVRYEGFEPVSDEHGGGQSEEESEPEETAGAESEAGDSMAGMDH